MVNLATLGVPDRVCKKCGESKPDSEFAKNGVTPDKKHPFCNGCRKAVVLAGWEKRKIRSQSQVNARNGGQDEKSDQVLTAEEWWDIFQIVVAGLADEVKRCEAQFGRSGSKAHESKKRLAIATERLHAAIVEKWGFGPSAARRDWRA